MRFDVYDTTGKVTNEICLVAQKQQLEIENLPSGIYFMCLNQEAKTSVKFIKE